MLENNLEIVEFDPRSASEEDFRRLNAFSNRMHEERWPGDPPITLDQTIRDERGRPEFVEAKEWTVHRSGQKEVLATAAVNVWHVGDNQHVADFTISVLPEMRRRGIAKALLSYVARAADQQKRRLLLASTNSRVPAGEAFLNRLGAEMALANYTNELKIEELDRELVRHWLDRAGSLQEEFELGVWAGPYPEEDLEAITRLDTVMNTAPRGSLQLEDWTSTVEEVRAWEAAMLERRVERCTMYVRHRKSGDLVGYTIVTWNPEQPRLLSQGNTAVFPEFRNRGLATWLKAAMIDKVLRERPQVERVRTGNAQSNAPMLSINQRLGFKPAMVTYNWQVGLDRVFAYLEGQRAS